MSTRLCIQATVCGLAVTVLIVASTGEVHAARASRPNILVIVADDLGWGHVGWQNPKVITPNLDRLAAKGIRLHQHYVAPVCSPTRVALMTGRYSSRFGCNGPLPSEPDSTRRAMPAGTETIASVLAAAGYRTALIGKWHLGASRESGPEQFGFGFFHGIRVGGCTPLTHRWLGIGPSVLWRGEHTVEESGHITDLLGQEAVQWITGDPRRPFFLCLSFTAPHVPLQESDPWMARYESIAPDVGHQLYWAAISHMDAAVGQVLAEIDRLGQSDHTLTVFFSDNGAPGQHNRMQVRADEEAYLDVTLPDSNSPLRGRKGHVYEGGIRTPAFVCWPAMLQSGACDVPLHVVDWLPTLCALVGHRPARDLQCDGRDIMPQLTGASPDDPHRTLYFQSHHGLALRQGDWKLVVPRGSEAELYNIAQDVGETTNLAAERPRIVQQLQSLLRAETVRDEDALPE